MRIAILSDISRRGTRAGLLMNNNRSSGSHYIAAVARQHGHDATNIDYWLSWPKDKLISGLRTWLSADSKPCIALNGSIDSSSLAEFKLLCRELKDIMPTLTVILGGFRVITGSADWVDISFIGRCTNIFVDWLHGNDISSYVISRNPLTVQNPIGTIIDSPVAPIPDARDFWNSHETPTLELKLGCKFNCSFCGYDYRNNQSESIISFNDLYWMLQESYNKFGISRFVLSDDTINESDNKLELLGDVVSKLTFTPEFSGFVRLDLLGARPNQIDLLKRANVNSMFFGIETLSPKAAKLVRKGGKAENSVKALRRIKTEYPDAFTFGNLIVGITHDSKKSLLDQADMIVNEQLLSSAGSNSLRIYKDLHNPEILSEIDAAPEKFGYTVYNSDHDKWPELGYSSQYWENDWINAIDASILSKELDEFFMQGLQSVYTSHEKFSIETIWPGLTDQQYNLSLPLINQKQTKNIKTYIQNKLNWLLTV